MVAAFPGADLTAKANNYKAWLTGQLIDYVFTIEMTAMRRSLDIQAQAKAAEIQASLPPRPAFTPLGSPAV